MTLLRTHLKSIGPYHLRACDDALEWVGRRRSWSKAWRDCQRGDWLLWLCGAIEVDRRLVARAAAMCAASALRYIPPGEAKARPRNALRAVCQWSRGRASIDEVRRAREDVHAAASAAALDAAYSSADRAAYDASQAALVASDAAADGEHADVAAASAANASGRVACHESLAKSAATVRRVIPWSVVAERLGT